MQIFPKDLIAQAQSLHGAYQAASPFPHAVIDNFLLPEALQAALHAFPSPDALDYYRYENPLEKKLAFDQVAALPNPIAKILWAMNSPLFLRFLEELTGIDGLIPDPYYRGGGLHQIVPGGKLDVHIDFNRYTKLGLYRRLNAILYLNENWQEAFGGCLELWSGHQENGKHVLDERVKSVLPIFNRLVVFSTSNRSYHGHPDALACPEGMTRKSLATYYYTTEDKCPAEEIADTHSTIFVKRPHEADDAELEALREKRNRGRLSSNVNSDLVAK